MMIKNKQPIQPDEKKILSKKIFIFILIGILIAVPTIVLADIKSDSLIINTKSTTWNVTSSASVYSMSVNDNGLKMKASMFADEKTLNFYRLQSSTPLIVSMKTDSINNANFTINNSLPSDTMLNVTGAQIQNLYLNGILSNNHPPSYNDQYHYAGGVNVISIGSARNVEVDYLGTSVIIPVPPAPVSAGGGGVPAQPQGTLQSVQSPIVFTIPKVTLPVVVGETKSSALHLNWNSNTNIVINSIHPSTHNTWIGFQTTPLLLQANSDGNSGQDIGFSVLIPQTSCDSTFCGLQQQYDIPVVLEGTYNSEAFETTSTITLVVGNPILTPQIQLPILLIILLVLVITVYYIKTHKGDNEMRIKHSTNHDARHPHAEYSIVKNNKIYSIQKKYKLEKEDKRRKPKM